VVFAGTPIDQPLKLITLGLIVSLSGQLGDLTLSRLNATSVLRLGCDFPGHGDSFDRFNSLLFAAPAVFHYVGYIQGIGLNQVPRIITKG